jgi:hypothetical protein
VLDLCTGCLSRRWGSCPCPCSGLLINIGRGKQCRRPALRQRGSMYQGAHDHHWSTKFWSMLQVTLTRLCCSVFFWNFLLLLFWYN